MAIGVLCWVTGRQQLPAKVVVLLAGTCNALNRQDATGELELPLCVI